jgi:hypothetical protein
VTKKTLKQDSFYWEVTEKRRWRWLGRLGFFVVVVRRCDLRTGKWKRRRRITWHRPSWSKRRG